MPSDEENLIGSVGMDLSDWDEGLRQLEADERKIEKILDDVVEAANDAESAIADVEANIEIDVDTSELEKAKNVADDFGNIDSNIDFSVDDGELETVRRLIADIDGDAPTVDIEVDDSEVETAQGEVADIDGESPDVEVDVDKDEVDETQTILEQIRNMQAIEIVMNVIGNASEFLASLENIPGIGSIVEMDNAMASFEARTGHTAANLDGLVATLHGQGIVAGRQEISDIAVQATQMGVAWSDVDEAAAAVFNTITVTGGDATETLTTMNQLVSLGLVDNFTEASDLIVAGFQTGANRGGDFLDVLNEYGSTFAHLGIDGESALALINSGLAAGFDNADRVADAVREMGIRVGELDFDAIDEAMTAFENGEITVDELNTTLGETGVALNSLGLLDETEAFLNGELSGEDYFNSVITALNNVEDASDQAQAAIAIFGTQAEDAGTEAITRLTTEPFEDIEGRAQEAADTMSNTIGSSIAEVQQLIDDLAVEFFSSDQLDIDGKLDDIKAAIQTFIDQINNGATFGEALEIALGAPGLEDSIHDLEAVIGNIALAIMQGMAGVLDLLGQGSAATSLRASVTDMAEGQLIFDIQVANDAQGVTEAVQRAIDRGVSDADIQAAMETAFNEAMASGDFEMAQMIVDNINSANAAISDMDPGQLMSAGEVPVTLTVDTADYQAQIDQAVADTQTAIDEALAAGDVSTAATLAQSIGSTLVDEFTRLVSEGNFDLAAIIAEGSPESNLDITYAAEQAGYSDEAIALMQARAADVVSTAEETAVAAAVSGDATTTALDTTAAATSTFSSDTETALVLAGGSYTQFESVTDSALSGVRSSIAETATAAQGLVLELENVTNAAVTASSNAASVSTSSSTPGHWTGGVDSGLFTAGEHGTELISTDESVAILNHATSESILSGLAELLHGGYNPTTRGGDSTININQNNTFNNNGAAASTASLDRASSAIRGF